MIFYCDGFIRLENGRTIVKNGGEAKARKQRANTEEREYQKSGSIRKRPKKRVVLFLQHSGDATCHLSYKRNQKNSHTTGSGI
jgi:hypothetical protein